MGLKLIGIGVIKYLRDKMNYLDGTVVLLSIVEMSFISNSNAVSAFRTVKIFRTFRVLRVARLLRSMNSMQVIINVLMKSLSSFVYLAFLLILFIFIYSLLLRRHAKNLFIYSSAFEETYKEPLFIPWLLRRHTKNLYLFLGF